MIFDNDVAHIAFSLDTHERVVGAFGLSFKQESVYAPKNNNNGDDEAAYCRPVFVFWACWLIHFCD